MNTLQQNVDLSFIQEYLSSHSNGEVVYEIPERIIFRFDHDKLAHYFYDIDLKLYAKGGQRLTLKLIPGIQYIFYKADEFIWEQIRKDAVPKINRLLNL